MSTFLNYLLLHKANDHAVNLDAGKESDNDMLPTATKLMIIKYLLTHAPDAVGAKIDATDAYDPSSSSDNDSATEGDDEKPMPAAIASRSPPQAYDLLRVIVDRRWKHINNIRST